MEKFGGGGANKACYGRCANGGFAFRAIRHFNISHNAPYLPSKICISTVFSFSWDGCNTQHERKTKVMQIFSGQIRGIMGNLEVAYITFFFLKKS